MITFYRHKGLKGAIPQLPVTLGGGGYDHGVMTERDRATTGLLYPRSKGWLSGYSYRKSFTYSRASGAVENYPVKIHVGESSGVNFISNGGFDSDATGWDVAYGTPAVIAGGEAGNCLQITRLSGDYQVAKQNVTLSAGSHYTATVYVKSGTSGNEEALLEIRDSDTGSISYASDSVTTSASWQQLSVTFTAGVVGIQIRLVKNTATAGTMLFDTAIIRPTADCNAHCLSTFNDLRFTDSDGNELDYWIESIAGTTPNQRAIVWVELNSVGTSNTTFYMYYGKADAAAGSDGDATFPFFDHFLGDAIDTDKWAQVIDNGSEAVADSVFAVVGHASYNMWGAKTQYGVDYCFRGRVKASADSNPNISIFGIDDRSDGGGYAGSGVDIAMFQYNDSAKRYTNYREGSTTSTTGRPALTDYTVVEIRRNSTTSVLYYISDVLKATISTNVPTDDAGISMFSGSASETIYWDWVLVYPYLATPPALGSWGSEEAA